MFRNIIVVLAAAIAFVVAMNVVAAIATVSGPAALVATFPLSFAVVFSAHRLIA